MLKTLKEIRNRIFWQGTLICLSLVAVILLEIIPEHPQWKFFIDLTIALLLTGALVFVIQVMSYVKTSLIPTTEKAIDALKKLSFGQIPKVSDEFENSNRDVARVVNRLIQNRKKEIAFANAIGSGNLDHFFEPVSKRDLMGNELHQMRKRLLSLESENKSIAKKESKDELLKINDQLDKFLNSTSHDLRAPLTTMKGLISILQATKNFDPELVCNMSSTTERMLLILEQVATFQKNNHTPVTHDLVDIKDIVNSIWMSVAHEYDPVHLSIYINDSIPFFNDADRIYKILYEILTNALKNKDVLKQRSVIKVNIIHKVDGININIFDNGVGVPSAEIDRVFNMFHKSSVNSSGAGLGLYIVKENINKLGGSIIFDSELNMGTSVTITLPSRVDGALEEVQNWGKELTKVLS